MADQQRWFKLWVTAPADDALQALPPETRWAWAVLGCYIKAHGTHGRVILHASNHALAAQMCVAPDALIKTISLLPHVQVEEGKSVNGEFTVTWQNWPKYQEDSTVAERVKTLRSKRREEKKRKEEKRKEVPPDPPFLNLNTSSRNGEAPTSPSPSGGNAVTTPVVQRSRPRPRGPSIPTRIGGILATLGPPPTLEQDLAAIEAARRLKP